MPTGDRRPFVAAAVGSFLAQSYPERELLILDDGADRVADLVPADDRVRYVRLDRRLSLGAKRNLACEQARGELIAHWDDDDWHAPRRLNYQVDALLASGKDVCGLQALLFYEPEARRAWRYDYPRDQRFWLSGSSLVYRRSFWERNRFPDVNVGEDALFVWAGSPDRMLALDDPTIHVGLIHRGNTSPKQTSGPFWRPWPLEEVLRLIGGEGDVRADGVPAPAPRSDPAPPPPRERALPAFAAALADDLAMTEFVALNEGQNLPRMRRWEIPFALYQSRLENTGTLFDCTINPAGFGERLARHYPHVLYRHCRPIEGGRFVLPVGVPDGGFDRVVCVNTLEHLLAPQRAALFAEMARKLRPGGRLIVTCDWYFDASWDDPAFLRLGVMKADRQEVFNGWNRVTVDEWLDLARRNGLEPLEPPAFSEPRPDDAGLYLNTPPHAHACIGGVFVKPPRSEPSAGKTVLLALLTWNTRDVSLDSVRAYLREAGLLRRLGHRPVLCVCDNGSADGTPEALRALEPEVDIPFRWVLNPTNLGNSIARNQILDVMNEFNADYVLMMDGDIEVIPFSSVAMLRHMENHGSRLGCLGADSMGQSRDRARTTRALFAVDPARTETTNVVAWTQYGLFRREVFDGGVRFDESDPFAGPGWGFEDNDLAFQMDVKGYLNQRFYGAVYLHRDARSSIRNMRAQQIDPQVPYERRRRYILEKWASVPAIHDGPLQLIRRLDTRL